jgi:hypothetical protein
LGLIRFTIILCAFLAITSSFTHEVVGQQIPAKLPDPVRVKLYIETLLDQYHTLVDQYYASRSDFGEIKGYFTLYNQTGNSFEVIVVETNPTMLQGNSQFPPSNPINLIFIPIRGTNLEIVMDQKDTFATLSTNSSIMVGPLLIGKDLPLTYNGTTIRQDVVLGIDADVELTDGYKTWAINDATVLYNQDEKQVPSVPVVNQTLTVNLSVTRTPVSNQTVIVQPATTYLLTNTQNAFSWFNDNPLIKTIVTIFGSVATFLGIVITIVIVVLRKQVTKEIKKLLRAA